MPEAVHAVEHTARRPRGGASRPVRHPLVELTLARMREFVREPEALFWVFAFPVMMTMALGIAFRSRADDAVRVGVEAREGAEQASAALERAGGFIVERLAAEQVDRALRDGLVQVVVVAGTPPTYRFDQARAESQYARLAVDQALQRAAGRADAFTPVERPVTDVGARYIDWLVPGLLGMNIMSTGLWGIGFGIVQARTRKLLKRFAATPMSRAHYLMSHVASRLVFLAGEAVVLVGFSYVAFDVTVQGSLLGLSVVSLLGAMSFGGVALLVASRAQTVEAVSGLLNLVMLPMWVLSGVFFASSNFPPAMQPAVQVLPLTALNDALRGIVNEGLPLTALAGELAILAGWGVVCFVLALRLFRWR
jgi:ABC-2 type transport system permease protein